MSFVLSKTSLAIIKALTILHLELQAAVIATRLKSKIAEEIDFEIDEMRVWSDSEIVLHYLKLATPSRNLAHTCLTELLRSSQTWTLRSGITFLAK